MSNFLVILLTKGNSQAAKEVFCHGVQCATSIRQQKPSEQLEMDWAYVATFPRINGTNCPLLVDPGSGDWVLVSGTWFHQEGWGFGQEQRLFERIQEAGIKKVAGELEGFFVLVFGDGRKKTASVVTDLIGSSHAYIRSFPGISAISGSSLILASLSPWSLDPVGCQEFLCTGVMYEERSFYQEVRKLPPSSILNYYDGCELETSLYWNATDLIPESLHGQQAIEEVSHNLLRVVQAIGNAFSRPVCDLTGGYDSRAVAAAFLNSGVPFQTTVSGNPESGDVQVSKAIAAKFGLSHWQMPNNQRNTLDELKQLIWLTDGEYDLFEYARIFSVHRLLMDRYTVSVNGSFGEVARGYWWELLWPNPAGVGKLDGELVARKRYAVQAYDEALFEPSQKVDLVKHFGGVIERTNIGLWNFPKSFQMDHAYLRMRMQRWQGRIASSTNQIWPCISPFMFRSVLEPLLQIRVSFRRRNQFMCSLLQRLEPELAKMPMEHGWPSVPFGWNTAHRFWPVPLYYGKKVLDRLWTTCCPPTFQSNAVSSIASQRLDLWERFFIKDLLNEPKMKLGEILNKKGLKKFIANSQAPIFPFEEQWARLVSFELALGQAQEIRLGLGRDHN